jgi:ABC-type multidrug transport system fused ATPase/permease subunit
MMDLRNQLYRHLQRQSLGFYTSTRAGEIVSRVNNDVGAVREVATGYECGVGLNNFNDFQVGDILEFYHKEKVSG